MYAYAIGLLAQIFANAFLLWRGNAALPKHGPWRRLFTIFILAEVLFYFIGYPFYITKKHEVVGFFMNITNPWFFFLIYAGLFTVILELLALIDRYTLRWYRYLKPQRKTPLRATLFVAVAIGSAGLLLHGIQKMDYPITKHLTIATPHAAIDGRKSIRIAFIADTHMSCYITERQIRRMEKIILENKPDVLLVGGDIFDNESYWGYKPELMHYFRHMAKEIPLGCFFVMGNHEYRQNTQKKKEWVAQVGGKLLIDDVALVGNCFYLIGRDDATQEKTRKPLQELLKHIPADKPTILLEHQPKEIDRIAQTNIDLSLFGHTHAGQIFPFTLMVRAKYPLVYGLMKKNNHFFYVTSGVGGAATDIRIGTRSEVVIIDFQFANNKNTK